MCNYQGNITKKNWTEIRWFYLGILKEQSDVKTSLSLEKSEKKIVRTSSRPTSAVRRCHVCNTKIELPLALELSERIESDCSFSLSL